MKIDKTTEELRRVIHSTLTPIINNDVILLDCPYHINIGDTLIWQGELDYLDSIHRNPIAQHSHDTFNFYPLSAHTVICLHGGGNFGDLYREAQEFRKQVIRKYPNNRIVLFPQSVWYEDKSLIEEDSKLFSKHTNLFLCARDNDSYEFMKQHFPLNTVLLVPDMAFYINGEHLKGDCINKNGLSTVYIKRLDKELDKETYMDISDKEIRDWPSFERFPLSFRIIDQFLKILRTWPFSIGFVGGVIDKIMNSYIRKKQVRKGVRFLNQYNSIITTRLHAMILGLLLNKKVVGIDNITHKISAYYRTWLTNDKRVEIVEDI